jgi:predicted AlkP superfamily phosphohydrolase/phosphomutase
MENRIWKNKVLGLMVLCFCLIASLAIWKNRFEKDTSAGLKLYWFLPDGLRAEPEIFQIFSWAESGELPNLKRMMREGSWGYSRPVFPSHTPVNFATLMTGASPKVHGIADGAMRTEGYPLAMVSRGGFSSVSKRVPSIWSILENANFLVSLLSVPGSTPPELVRGNTIKGRWGAWGLDFPAINFHDRRDKNLLEELGQNKRVFTFGSDLTKFLSAQKPEGWASRESFSPARQVEFTNWGSTMWGLILDSTNDGKENYDRVLFSANKKDILADLKVGEWSEWIALNLSWQMKNDYNIHTPKKTKLEEELSKIEVESRVKIGVIKLGEKDFFRIRFFYDGLNEYSTQPPGLAEKMRKAVGPMVDFVDNYPPQLIYYPEDKNAFLQESLASLDWHKKSVAFLTKDLQSEVVIQSIYTPNQMMTSRWWLPFLDPKSPLYSTISEEERSVLWAEMKQMYKKIDEILGEILAKADPNTYVVFGSDHGALPLYKEVRLNNYFYKKGWLKFQFNKEREEWEVDWPNTKVVFLQMDNIYLSPRGLGGNYRRDSGQEYEALREEVIAALAELKDAETEISPLASIWKWEHAEEHLDLPKDRVGDLVIANRPPYLWAEDMSPAAEVFVRTKKGGYKQGVAAEELGLLTPFAIRGPNIPANRPLNQVIHHEDQAVTIYRLLGLEVPEYATGKEIQFGD